MTNKTTREEGYADGVQRMIGCLDGDLSFDYLQGFFMAINQSLDRVRLEIKDKSPTKRKSSND